MERKGIGVRGSSFPSAFEAREWVEEQQQKGPEGTPLPVVSLALQD